MDQNNSFAAGSPASFERERLGLLRDLADPITTRRLIQLPVGSACADPTRDDPCAGRPKTARASDPPLFQQYPMIEETDLSGPAADDRRLWALLG
jgi:hypothetical protein